MFKETKGMTLEEIDLLFGDRALGSLPADITMKNAAMGDHLEHAEKDSDGKVVRESKAAVA